MIIIVIMTTAPALKIIIIEIIMTKIEIINGADMPSRIIIVEDLCRSPNALVVCMAGTTMTTIMKVIASIMPQIKGCSKMQVSTSVIGEKAVLLLQKRLLSVQNASQVKNAAITLT